MRSDFAAGDSFGLDEVDDDLCDRVADLRSEVSDEMVDVDFMDEVSMAVWDVLGLEAVIVE